ncbi:MAG: glutaminyl-peptide cyclotransferase [Reichenbachiella sp.]
MTRHNIYFLIVVLLLSCSKSEKKNTINKSPRIKNQTSILSPKNGSTYTIGETIHFEIGSNDDIAVDSVVIKKTNTSKNLFIDKSFTIDSKSYFVGRNDIVIAVYFDNGKKEIKPLTIFLNSDIQPKAYTYRVLDTHPHNTEAYTQGLLIDDGVLYESTGGHGRSNIRTVNLTNGNIQLNISLEKDFFGEGIATYQNYIYMLTWKSRKGMIYDKNTLEFVRSFYYPTDGWGLTTKNDTLIMSDGTEVLYFMEPQGFTEVKRIEVYDNMGKIDSLNELEYFNEYIYANRWLTDIIYKIDPSSGKVLGTVDLSGLLDTEGIEHEVDVLNGIAFDKKLNKIYVTGKLWPSIFEIEFVDRINNI